MMWVGEWCVAWWPVTKAWVWVCAGKCGAWGGFGACIALWYTWEQQVPSAALSLCALYGAYVCWHTVINSGVCRLG